MKEVTRFAATAYGIAKKYGYVGTEAEFAAQLLSGNGAITIGNGLTLDSHGTLSIDGEAVESELSDWIAGLMDDTVPTAASSDDVSDIINSVFGDDTEQTENAENNGNNTGEE